jgi:hypothetical protein
MPTPPRPRTATASDPSRGFTLDDLAEFVADCMGHYELPGSTVVRCKGMIELDLVNGPRIAQLTAVPEEQS